MTTALDFLRKAGKDGRIVSSGDLTTTQIAEFQAEDWFWVDPETNYGYAIVPWDLTTPKDRQRESEYFDVRLNISRRKLQQCRTMDKQNKRKIL